MVKKFTFTVTTETTECYTLTWKVYPIDSIRQEDYDSGERSKDFMTEEEARKFAYNLKHEENVMNPDGMVLEYRKIIDLNEATPRVQKKEDPWHGHSFPNSQPPPPNTTFRKI